jgi:hypothetical protein
MPPTTAARELAVLALMHRALEEGNAQLAMRIFADRPPEERDALAARIRRQVLRGRAVVAGR